MNRDDLSWKSTAVAVAIAVLPLVCLADSAADAQSFMRSPTLRVEPRVSIGPRINPNIAGRVGANAAGRAGTNIAGRVNANAVGRVEIGRAHV